MLILGLVRSTHKQLYKCYESVQLQYLRKCQLKHILAMIEECVVSIPQSGGNIIGPVNCSNLPVFPVLVIQCQM